MNSETEIVGNSKVTLHFSLSLTDGTMAISTFEEEPMTLTMGDGNFMPGMEMALYGLKADAEQILTLTPEQAYGYPDPELIHDLPLSDFSEDSPPEAGQVLAFSLPNGEETPGLITEVTTNKVKVDFNHPLSGHDVVFKVKIISVTNPDDSQD